MQGPPSIKSEDYRELLEKLAALRLPPLKGKRFLNVNCGDGFFCGYAAFSDAALVVGIDGSEGAITLAKANFPGCTFLHDSREELPEQDFDVILLTSAAYHTKGLGALIHRLMGKLAADGSLIIEIAIVDAKENFVKVREGDTDFILPSWNPIKIFLDRYAWKSIGHRAFLREREIAQHIIHVRSMKPYAFLLLEPPASGKSTLQRVAFKKTGVRLVSGDQALLDIFHGNISASRRLEELVKNHFISTSIAKLTKIIFTDGLGEELIDTWCEQAGFNHFVLDSYLHKKFHPQLQNHLKAKGYVPVTINWSLNPDIPLPKQAIAATEMYRVHLQETLKIDDPAKLPAIEYRSAMGPDSSTGNSIFSRVRKAIVGSKK
jgi:SAM-dependent methyltransferase